jgi:glycosyltransferase involved in cell wall biosynthesis
MLHDSAPYTVNPPWKYPGFYRRAKEEAIRSRYIVERTDVPMWMLGNPRYLDGLDYEQDLATPLSVALKKASESEGKRIIDEFVAFNKALISRSLVDRGFTIATNFALDREGRVILTDLGELRDDKEEIERIISSRPWALPHVFHFIPIGLRAYFLSEMDRALAPEHDMLLPLTAERALRILWVVSSGWKEGGVENLLVLAKEELEQQGHVVRTLSSDARPDMPHFSDSEYPTPRGLLRPFLYSYNPAAKRAIERAISEFSPDVVHIHTIGHASPSILFGLKGIPTVLTVHGPEGFVKSLIPACQPPTDFKNESHDVRHMNLKGKLRYTYHRFVNGPIYALGFKHISSIATPSRYMNALATLDGLPNVIFPNGIELLEARALPSGGPHHRIVYAGRLETYKGVNVLLRAFAEFLKRYPKAHLRIAGEGSVRESLDALVSTLGIGDRIEFLGHIDRAGLQELYEWSEVAVMPSTWVEAFGLSGIEAMSVGRPVIASRVGGIPDWLIDGKTGSLVPPGDVRALLDALLWTYEDRGLLSRLSVAARDRALEFGLAAHVDSLLSFYARAISREGER